MGDYYTPAQGIIGPAGVLMLPKGRSLHYAGLWIYPMHPLKDVARIFIIILAFLWYNVLTPLSFCLG